MNNFSLSNLSIAASVKRVNLPGVAPGAKSSAFRLLTSAMSKPGMFLAAFLSLQS